ncbi:MULTISPECIES: metal-dependent hydrolase [Vibrio]|uniref:metal-dependent hydrolase n=1 Tax=Vibrio TaxID=662 RepID=UPI0020756CF3|nr:MULTISPECIES: metal-dependent hydrolase [Vibrio]USD33967.1 metal-dependent hydrolase [Vibrio sp. SCSIO 43186]USD44237.1 metal-dependent hydrolase [Vibrio sp. SCSIO 43145]USD71090.1 metal-dependent hydrolase [Vibrio sp. SCSIO 43139]USD95996.1 metal-dependent hydrolase [Vibrio coralliilyticus]
MDPLTQGLIGAALPQSVCNKKHVLVAGGLGLLAGMSPDLDVLIRSSSDPLLFLEYHRQFTHSLFFIPFGSLLCALVLHWLLARRCGLAFGQSWLYCTLGYSTHALLDACTSYGTQLLWPFTQERYAWNMVSVVDPIFTFPILICLAVTFRKPTPWGARIALLWGLTYLSLGIIQKERAYNEGLQLAQERNHSPNRIEVKPSFANILVWKVIYETNGHYHVDAIRLGRSAKIYSGESIAKLDINRDLPWLKQNSQQAKDIERFRRFSNGYLALHPNDKLSVIDVRYSMIPNQFDPMWSIKLSPSLAPEQHARYVTNREHFTTKRQDFWEILLGLGGGASE